MIKNLKWAALLAVVFAIVPTASARPHHSYHSHHVSHYYGPRGGRHYTNVDGHSIHSPMHASHRPAGASAHCRDGSWSFSQHARGTCSHHGGVSG